MADTGGIGTSLEVQTTSIDTRIPCNSDSVRDVAAWFYEAYSKVSDAVVEMTGNLLWNPEYWMGETANAYEEMLGKLRLSAGNLSDRHYRAYEVLRAYAQQLDYHYRDMETIRHDAEMLGLRHHVPAPAAARAPRTRAERHARGVVDVRPGFPHMEGQEGGGPGLRGAPPPSRTGLVGLGRMGQEVPAAPAGREFRTVVREVLRPGGPGRGRPPVAVGARRRGPEVRQESPNIGAADGQGCRRSRQAGQRGLPCGAPRHGRGRQERPRGASRLPRRAHPCPRRGDSSGGPTTSPHPTLPAKPLWPKVPEWPPAQRSAAQSDRR